MLLSTLEYASYLSYSPHGTTDVEKKSQRLMNVIKQEKLVSSPSVPMSEFIAQRIANELESLPFKNFFGKDVSLVPIPKSSLMKPETLWVPHRLVQALCKLNLGKELDCLKRTKPVNKAASSKPADRPKPIEHCQTISIQKVIETPKHILLVDDVVTRGAALLGSASLLHEAFPDVQIRGFAVLRTIHSPSDFNSINSPVVGQIKLIRDQAYRYQLCRNPPNTTSIRSMLCTKHFKFISLNWLFHALLDT